MVDFCCHDTERDDLILDIYEKYRWEWSFEKYMMLKKPRKILRSECIKKAVKSTDDPRL